MAKLNANSMYKLMSSLATRKNLALPTQEMVIITTTGALHTATRQVLGMIRIPKNKKPKTPRGQYAGSTGTNAYPPNLKKEVQDRLIAHARSAALSQEYGISLRTLARWRAELKARGEIVDA